MAIGASIAVVLGVVFAAMLITSLFGGKVHRIGCSVCRGGFGEGPYYCGRGRVSRHVFFADGTPMEFGSRVCTKCGTEYFD
jgi:hypothetical protein